MSQQVLDPCCGSRKFYFDKSSEVVLYGDIRSESYVQCDGRTLTVAPVLRCIAGGRPLGFLRKGFEECWRVLKPNGTLIFKWNTNQFSLPIVLNALPQKPPFGNRKPGGKAGEAYWMVFFKGAEND